ncbi:hypothetical protein PDESU_04484 [Pontiella desulfatans]|uniref:Uroporphyrinogen decarboxylase (URO-D) domain-containing protein n=1 Tax=Pontiella desulfatans TaxID=2750659 RepID=A0A6C2U927_PONDE|nr:hypothetical protein [Pontiella desulfatans]VGO15896.1 hypothetical protein PDESU_04484 [Pontiella desulfatans]
MSREKAKAAFNGEMTDRIPQWDVPGCPALAEQLFDYDVQAEEVLEFQPKDYFYQNKEERSAFFKNHYAQKQTLLGDSTMVMGWYNHTLFMWPVELFGWENFMMAAMDDPGRFEEILQQFLETVLDVWRGKTIFACMKNPKIINFGSKEEIRDMVRETVKLAIKEPGYFFSTDTMTGKTPPENILAYQEAVREFGKR